MENFPKQTTRQPHMTAAL